LIVEEIFKSFANILETEEVWRRRRKIITFRFDRYIIVSSYSRSIVVEVWKSNYFWSRQKS
jgi:hypothetical protein